MNKIPTFFLLLSIPSLIFAQKIIPACSVINSSKKPAFYLVDRNGFISDGKIKMGDVFIGANTVLGQNLFDTGQTIIATPKNLEYVDTCGQGLCIKLTKLSPVCKNGQSYKVSLAISINSKNALVNYYELKGNVGRGYKFLEENNGYKQEVDQFFGLEIEGRLVK